MRIAILAPAYLPVPPPLYGGTEKIVSLLTDGLVEHGHDVTLFASGDSKTTAKLSSIFLKALGNSGLTKGDTEKPLAHYDSCYKRAREFDIIHSHGQYLSLEGAENLPIPVVFTWHGSFYEGETSKENRTVLQQHKHFNYVSISNNQRGGMSDLHYVATVYNALDIGEYEMIQGAMGARGNMGTTREEYLLWVGRMSPKKGALEAILTAKKLGIRLEMAAVIDPIDRAYFEEKIKPLIDGISVIYHGEVGHDALVELYSGALATLYPISWHEPFGLVMIESMACGTPVVAFNCGSVSEIVRDGLTGWIVEEGGKGARGNKGDKGIQQTGIKGLVEAIGRIGEIDRHACRRYVEDSFSKERMVEGYEKIYSVLGSSGK